jgi:hypothetical protein
MRIFTFMVAIGFLSVAFAQTVREITVDPQSGRAIGAKEMSPDELRSHIDKKTKLLIVDVRDPEEFEKETIKNAVNIPIGQLEAKLKEIPRDTMLVFT